MTSHPIILGDGGHQDGTYSATRYANVGLGRCVMLGGGGFTNESYVRQKIHVAGTISELSWGLDQAFGTTLTYTLRQNAANTALAVSFGSSDTGWMTDSTDSVSVSSGDWLDFEADIGASTTYSGSFYCASARLDAVTIANTGAQMLATVGPSTMNHSTADQYGHFLGILSFGVTNESQEQFYALTSGTWERMACYVQSNGLSATTTVKNRDNASDGSMTIAIPAGSMGTGNFEDTTHTDAVISADLLDYQFHSAATTGSLLMDWVGCHFLPTGAHCMIGGTPDTSAIISSGTTKWYSSLFGGGNIATDYTRATGKFPYAATVTNFGNFLIAADTNGAATFTLLINDQPSVLAVSSGMGQTGWFISDATESASVLAGDTCTNQVVGSGDTGTHVTWAGAGLLVSS